MKTHWRKVHHWAAGRHGGRKSTVQRREMEKAIARSQRRVLCQRVFPSKQGSHFIRIEPGDANGQHEIDPENDG
ncbi:hypothetical protein PHISCL_10083 [Aspergillus sclerotialis]|uniref:Uncharacterized protein n=1 Tax=Aspergillus sclerotialis TaxID=2070753 RepID=A0A3A2Z3D4_9EURO|nr:hypothetical protein PHISCL_10083 [Aspergillus sclerotialis]